MEWVNITAKTLPEAIDRALDNLGVDEAEAEIEVLEEPKQGLFGRVRGNARVRARVKPRETRPKVERGRGRKRRNESGGGGRSGSGERSSSGGSRSKGRSDGRRQGGGDKERSSSRGDSSRGGGGGGGGRDRARDDGEKSSGERSGRGSKQKQAKAPVEESSMKDVSAHLETFLSGLTEAFGFEGPVSVDGDDEDGLVAKVDGRHGLMVGPKGRTLDAIQELARVSAQRSTPSNIRIKVDVGGYREMRAEALRSFATDAAEEAIADGKERSLEPMSAADRKIVHDALGEIDGVETRSAGTDPRRRVVVVPTVEVPADSNGADDSEDDGPATDDADTGDDTNGRTAGADEGAADDAESIGS